MWNDGVAPETALDFDVPHVSAATGLAWWLAGFGFFYGVWSFAKATGHPDNKPSVRAGGRRRPRGALCRVQGARDVRAPRCHRESITSPTQASRALPESTITTALGDHGHGKY